METTQSEIFSVSPKTYAAARARHYAGTSAAVLGLPLIISLFAGFHDIRWWFVGLMAIFIVYPMVLTMAWFSLTGSTEMSYLLRPQRWTFRQDKTVEIEFFRFDYDDNPEPVRRQVVTIEDISNGSRYAELKATKGQPFHILLTPTDYLPADFFHLF